MFLQRSPEELLGMSNDGPGIARFVHLAGEILAVDDQNIFR